MMTRQLRSLMAKEWAERRSTLVWGLVFAMLYLGYCVAYEIEYRPRAIVSGYYATCAGLGCLAAVLLAMPTTAGEYTRRTIRYSASLPISLRQMAWVRLLGAWACLAVPIIVGALLVTVIVASGLVEQAELRGTSSQGLLERASLSSAAAVAVLWTTTAISLVAALELMALLSLFGTLCRTERQVGFWGAIIALLWTIIPAIRIQAEPFSVAHRVAALFPQSLVSLSSYGLHDGTTYQDLELSSSVWWPIAGSLLVTYVLGCWFARRYGRRQEGSAVSPTMSSWWRLPTLPVNHFFRLPGRLGALIWLDLRQSLPLCLAGLTLALLITGINLFESAGETGTLILRLAGGLPSNSWYVGLLWSALVGVGIFAAELEPGLQHFWRTRPITPTTWFWTKFIVGLLAVVIVLDGLPAVIGWKSPYRSDAGRTGFVYLACMPLLHAQVYAIAVAAVCWLRRPIAAVVIAVLMPALTDIVADSIPGQTELGTLAVFNNLEADEYVDGVFNLMNHHYPLVYGFVFLITISATAIARCGALDSRPENGY